MLLRSEVLAFKTMPGTASAPNSSPDPGNPAIRADIDPNRTVWYSGGEVYHRDAEWGPACTDKIGVAEEHTIEEAADEGKRPCKNCEPVDYRRVAADGGFAKCPDCGTDVLVQRSCHNEEDWLCHGCDTHFTLSDTESKKLATDGGVVEEHSGGALSANEPVNDLDAALRFSLKATRQAEVLEVGEKATARLQIAEGGARLAFHADSKAERQLAVEEAREHLQAALSELEDEAISHSVRHALQYYTGVQEGWR